MKLFSPGLGLIVAVVVPLATRAAVAAIDTNFFPIMAWNSAPNDPVVLRKMREAGLTIAGFVSPGTLDACQEAGLKAIVSDARCSSYDWANVDKQRARSNVTELVTQTGQHPAV